MAIAQRTFCGVVASLFGLFVPRLWRRWPGKGDSKTRANFPPRLSSVGDARLRHVASSVLLGVLSAQFFPARSTCSRRFLGENTAKDPPHGAEQQFVQAPHPATKTPRPATCFRAGKPCPYLYSMATTAGRPSGRVAPSFAKGRLRCDACQGMARLLMGCPGQGVDLNRVEQSVGASVAR